MNVIHLPNWQRRLHADSYMWSPLLNIPCALPELEIPLGRDRLLCNKMPLHSAQNPVDPSPRNAGGVGGCSPLVVRHQFRPHRLFTSLTREIRLRCQGHLYMN